MVGITIGLLTVAVATGALMVSSVPYSSMKKLRRGYARKKRLLLVGGAAISGAILVLASVGWMFAPETRDTPPLEHTPARPLGPEAAGELP